jgi:phenylacetic acid degradation operon negative regulatory protein
MIRRMKPKTQELLYCLLWSADQLCRPTFRNLTDSFEQWSYRQGFQRQLWELERQQLLERNAGSGTRREYRLTERGRILALGGRDPVTAWARPWDGQWRMVVFDLPETKSATRTRLRRFLKDHGFGYLQNSVWITPDPLGTVMTQWGTGQQDVESLITFEARPCSGESNAAMVAGAWDFDQINAHYAKCLTVLEDLPEPGTLTRKAAAPLRRWARAEREAWLDAVSGDPLLPRLLLPNDYLGERVWEQRQETLARASRLIGEGF